MTKYGVPGWQDTGAVMGALLAQEGFIGDTTILDPAEGFWKLAGYEKLRRDQKRLRSRGRYLGIGVSTYVEICAMGPKGMWEYAR
jgi:2-methylcitrate dehydratase PrpD